MDEKQKETIIVDGDVYVQQEGPSEQGFYLNKDGPTKARQRVSQTPVVDGESTGKRGPSKKKKSTTPKQNDRRQTIQPPIASPTISINNNDTGTMVNKDVGNIYNSNFSNMGNNNSRNYYGGRKRESITD